MTEALILTVCESFNLLFLKYKYHIL